MQRGGQLVCAGRALLRTADALLIYGAGEGSPVGIVTSEQAALVTDAQRAVWELVDVNRTAHEVHALAGGGELQDDGFKSNRVVVAHHALVFGRQQQFQLDSRHRRKGALGLGRGDREATIEVGSEDFLKVAIGLRIGGDAVQAQFLGQAALDGFEGTLAASARLWGAGPDMPDTQRAQGLGHLAVLLLSRCFTSFSGAAEV